MATTTCAITICHEKNLDDKNPESLCGREDVGAGQNPFRTLRQQILPHPIQVLISPTSLGKLNIHKLRLLFSSFFRGVLRLRRCRIFGLFL